MDGKELTVENVVRGDFKFLWPFAIGDKSAPSNFNNRCILCGDYPRYNEKVVMLMPNVSTKYQDEVMEKPFYKMKISKNKRFIHTHEFFVEYNKHNNDEIETIKYILRKRVPVFKGWSKEELEKFEYFNQASKFFGLFYEKEKGRLFYRWKRSAPCKIIYDMITSKITYERNFRRKRYLFDDLFYDHLRNRILKKFYELQGLTEEIENLNIEHPLTEIAKIYNNAIQEVSKVTKL
jgi:hypothetical protein